MTIRLAALALLALPFAASAQAAAPAGNSTAQQQSAEQNTSNQSEAPRTRRVCRSEHVTGSNMPKRTCRMVAVNDEDNGGEEQARSHQNRMGTSAE